MEENQTILGENKAMAMLAYIGPLLFVPYFVARGDETVRFHIKQGMVLLVIEAALWVISVILAMPFLMPLVRIVYFVVVVFSIIGIVNVAQHKKKELPFIGSYAKYFNI